MLNLCGAEMEKLLLPMSWCHLEVEMGTESSRFLTWVGEEHRLPAQMLSNTTVGGLSLAWFSKLVVVVGDVGI